MLQVDIDSNIRYGKLEELVSNVPRAVTVNKFTEEGAAKFQKDMQDAVNTGQELIPILVDSYGGEVYALLSMLDSITQAKKSGVKIATVAKGKSMSCGAVLFSQGSEGYRYMSPFATLMIHDVSSWAHGKLEELKADVREAERLNNLIYNLMAESTGKDDPKYFWKIVHDMGRADWYLSANDAKHHNLANHIKLPSFKLKVSCNISFE